jgi:hypothetical protein
MPFQKIQEDTREAACTDREHNPPTRIHLEPGIYEWSCPSCCAKQIIRIRKPTW